MRAIRNFCGVATVVSLCGIAAAQPGGTISDANASLTIAAAPATGAATAEPTFNFSVDGGATNHVFGNWWWYRLSTDTREFAANSGGGGATSLFGGNIGQMTQNYPTFRADLGWQVESTGTQRGFFTASITVTNTSSAPIFMDFFNYMDVDLGGSAGGDSATLSAPGLMRITDSVYTGVAEYSAINANNYQVTAFATLRGLLTNTAVNNLANTGLPFVNGDFTGAFQWTNVQIDPGFSRSAIITFSIPSPSSLALLALGGLIAGRRRR